MRARRAWHRLVYFAADAWDEFRHSPGVNLLAVVTLAATLFLAGLVALVIGNVEREVRRERESAQLQVYLRDAAPPETVSALRRMLESMEGVAGVEFVDKAEAHRRFRSWSAGRAAMLEDLEANPLPASLAVRLSPGPGAEAVGGEIVERLRGRPGVEEVRFDAAWLRKVEAALSLARFGGSAIGLLAFAAVVFVMASVLRLAVYARRNEIEIMLLVGATPAFVRGPFLVAGFAQGLAASGLALLAVEAARLGSRAYAGPGALALLDLLLALPLSVETSALVVLTGVAVSLAGAFFAVRRSI